MPTPNFYMQNIQLLLKMAVELHKRGFERLTVEPSVSPSGMYWRCSYFNDDQNSIIASNWLQEHFQITEKLIGMDIASLANLFEQEHADFLETCRGENQIYVKWFAEMNESLHTEELPYAYSDYFQATEYWLTNEERKIYLSASWSEKNS